MRRRRQGGGNKTAAELVAAVQAAGLDGPFESRDNDRLHALLNDLGGYDVLHWIRARVKLETEAHGHEMRPGWVWDDGREGGNR